MFLVAIQSVVLSRDGSLRIRHGDSVTFTCRIALDSSVDTAVRLTVRHTGTDGTDVTNTATVSALLGVHNLLYSVAPSKAGSFNFTCTATASDATNSTFIDDSSQDSLPLTIYIGMQRLD